MNTCEIKPRSKITFTLAQAWLFAGAFGAAVYGGAAKLHEITDKAELHTRQLEAEAKQLETISKQLEALQATSSTAARWEWVVSNDIVRLGKATHTEVWTRQQP